MTSLRVALGEYDTGWHDPAGSLERAAAVLRRAGSVHAGLVVLPEMFLTGFTMEPAAHAEALDGPTFQAFADKVAQAGFSAIASISRRDDTPRGPRFFNSVVHVSPDGTIGHAYDKQQLFSYGGEHAVYTPGDAPPRILSVNGVRIATLVCYDLRFPELFREIADAADLIVVVANWPAVRRSHWDALLQARAIENQCYVVGVNRTGAGGPLTYDGGSAAYDPWGERIDRESRGIRVADVSPERVVEIREKFPFLKDRNASSFAR